MKQTNMKQTTKTLALLSLISLASQAGATIIAMDNFAYTDGDLNGNGAAGSGWAGGWSSSGGTQIQVTGGVLSGGASTRVARALSVAQGADGTTVYIGLTQNLNGDAFTALEGNITNWRFESNVHDGFADGSDTVNSQINATIGVESRFVLEFNFGAGNTDQVTLYQDGANVGSNTATGNYAFSSLSFASFGGSGDLSPTQNLIVATTFAEANAVPEPSSTALLGLGGLALILRRRR